MILPLSPHHLEALSRSSDLVQYASDQLPHQSFGSTDIPDLVYKHQWALQVRSEVQKFDI